MALDCFIGHSHWKSTRATKCDQGVQEKWYSISLLGWSHYHIFWIFASVAKVAFWSCIVTLSYFFFYQKVQHCGQACLLRHHMVLGVMVFCSNFLTFSLILTHSCKLFFFFFFGFSSPNAFICLRSSDAKIPGWLDTATFAPRHRSFENGSLTGKVNVN